MIKVTPENVKKWFVQYHKRKAISAAFPTTWPFTTSRYTFEEDTEIIRRYLCMAGFKLLTLPLNLN